MDTKVDTLAHNAETVLFRTTSVFPFDLFPDELIIDLNKVNVIYKQFFLAEQLYPIPLDKIDGVTLESSPLFSALKIEVTRFTDQPIMLKYLTNRDARLAKRIIIGLITCKKEGIDPAKLPRDKIMGEVEAIGTSRSQNENSIVTP